MEGTKRLTFRAMLLTMIIVVSIFEGMLPPMPFLPPGVKPGLANVVAMYAVFFTDRQTAYALTIAKSVFSFVTRGAIAGFLSACGGLLSISVIIFLVIIFKDKISYIAISIFGAVFHNIGQIIGCFFIFESGYIFYYLPFLIISGIIMGSITGVVLKNVLPVLGSLNLLINKNNKSIINEKKRTEDEK